jgi:hypothetical protein
MRNTLLDASGVRIQWGGGRVYTSVAPFQSSAGKGPNTLRVDSRSVNAAGRDFRIYSGSAAIDRAAAPSIYQRFQDQYGRSRAVDLATNPAARRRRLRARRLRLRRVDPRRRRPRHRNSSTLVRRGVLPADSLYEFR